MYVLNILKQIKTLEYRFILFSPFLSKPEVSISALSETKLVQATRVTQTVFSFFFSQNIFFFFEYYFSQRLGSVNCVYECINEIVFGQTFLYKKTSIWVSTMFVCLFDCV